MKVLGLKSFQLTRSRGAWRFSEKLKRTLSNFNSHAHVERDFSAIRLLTVLVLFQLTRSRGAWPQQIWKSVQTFSFQLTRSRGAWPVGSSSVGSSSVISTHTLTWSVTLLVISLIGITGFQLTRSRGAWLKCFLILWISSAFQLTRSRGAWHPQLWPYNRQRYFNSHAHVERDNGSWYARWRASAFQLTRSRGAWRAVVINHNVYNEFQLTRSSGAWLLRLHTPPVPLHFNSHAHVERDLISSFVVKSEWNFNSHAHVERDDFLYLLDKFQQISTHTLTWSVTRITLSWLLISRFQLTRSRGAWRQG